MSLSMDVFAARMRVREAAMMLARRGLDEETIREAMLDMAMSEAERAIAWGIEEDRRLAVADDRQDFADECARDELEDA